MEGSWDARSLHIAMALLQETQPLAHFKCSDSVILIVPTLSPFIQLIPHPIMASRTSSHLHLPGPSYQPCGFYSVYNFGELRTAVLLA